LEGLEIGCWAGATEVFAGDQLAIIVANLEMKGTPTEHMWHDEGEYFFKLFVAEGDAGDVLFGCHCVDKDVETTVWIAGAPLKVCGGTRNMRLLPEAEGGPEGKGSEGDMTPVLADVGDSELE
jgi:hypothetical protein